MRVSIPYWKRRKFEPNVIYIDPIVASFEVLGHSVVATTHGITIEPATDDDDDEEDYTMTVGKSYRSDRSLLR